MELNILPDYPKYMIEDLRSSNQNFWIISNNTGIMDDSEDYFNWSNDLKIDEGKIEDPSSTSSSSSKLESRNLRKRKLSGNNGNITTTSNNNNNNGNRQQLRDPLETVDATGEKQNGSAATGDGIQNGTSRMPAWQIEDISDLNADLEGSFTNLRNDLANNGYSMSEAILSIPGLPIFKQEVPSPTSNDQGNANHISKTPNSSNVHIAINTANRNLNINDGRGGNNTSNNLNGSLQTLLNGATYGTLQNPIDGNVLNTSPNISQDGFNSVSSSSCNGFTEDSRFQYVLAAATSIASKINEDTLTYLNQGQSYEIKLKKLGDLSTFRGKLLKSVIRVCFHERRLQYMEKEQMMLWQKSRPGDRILEVDVPLSYGLCEVIQPSNSLNTVCFSWDPTKEVGVYIKVNCISTEFTPRKHGGEKGVPFRIQVETYLNGNGSSNNNGLFEGTRRLHAAACQVKVFKLKGADRKHKQDREKILKRPVSEQEKYQPSYECTVLNDLPLDTISATPIPETSTRPFTPESDKASTSPVHTNGNENATVIPINRYHTQILNKKDFEGQNGEEFCTEQLLLQESNPETTSQWLNLNRFGKYLETFANFSGADMLRMTRCDLIQICGQADGIRLYNALHNKATLPKLTLFVCYETASVFSAIYLSSYSKLEIINKLTSLSSVPSDRIKDLYMQGPQGIKVQVTTEVIRHIKDEAMFLLSVIEDSKDIYYLLLKPVPK